MVYSSLNNQYYWTKIDSLNSLCEIKWRQSILSFSWVLQIRNILFFLFFLVKFTNIYANMLVLSPIMCSIWENCPFSRNIAFWWLYPVFYPCLLPSLLDLFFARAFNAVKIPFLSVNLRHIFYEKWYNIYILALARSYMIDYSYPFHLPWSSMWTDLFQVFLWYYKILVYLKSLFLHPHCWSGTPFSGVKLLQNPSVDTSIAVSLAMSVKHDPLGTVVFSFAEPRFFR